MGLKKHEWAVIAVATAFIILTAGYFAGRSASGGGLYIELQEPRDTPQIAATKQPVTSGEADEAAESNGELININTADAEELARLDGIGEKLGERIVAYREENGPFEAIDQLTDVSGIGEKKLAAIKGSITLGQED